VGARIETQIEGAVNESFVAGFRAAMFVSAGLALASALVAVLLIKDQELPWRVGIPVAGGMPAACRSYAPPSGRIGQ
jgi:hypothetical protein